MAARYHPNGLRIIDQELIDEVVRTIVEDFQPLRIVLFGSHARGDAGPDSDLDLMIEMETELRFVERSIAVRRLFPEARWPMDVVVYTPEEVVAARQVFGNLMSYIDAEGKVLYDSQPSRMVQESR